MDFDKIKLSINTKNRMLKIIKKMNNITYHELTKDSKEINQFIKNIL